MALAWAAERHLGEFSPYLLASTGGAIATAAQWDAAFSVALELAAERRLGEFSPSALANTVSAFATAAQCDAALARTAERLLGPSFGRWAPWAPFACEFMQAPCAPSFGR